MRNRYCCSWVVLTYFCHFPGSIAGRREKRSAGSRGTLRDVGGQDSDAGWAEKLNATVHRPHEQKRSCSCQLERGYALYR